MNTFTALSDPTRRVIVEILSQGELSAGDIAGHFEISGPAISQHLKVLREARLVQVRVDAQRRLYAPNPEGFAELEEWLFKVRSFWGSSLDRLEDELKKAVEKEGGAS